MCSQPFAHRSLAQNYVPHVRQTSSALSSPQALHYDTTDRRALEARLQAAVGLGEMEAAMKLHTQLAPLPGQPLADAVVAGVQVGGHGGVLYNYVLLYTHYPHAAFTVAITLGSHNIYITVSLLDTVNGDLYSPAAV